MQEQTPWHRLFGMMLTSFFEGSPFRVEYEKDLSFKAQFLDVVIIRGDDEGVVPPLPDGMRDSLVDHNLISFKSYRDTLSDWTLKELTCYYVNYRKQISPDMNDLLPEDRFRLFAVSAHYPLGLAGDVTLTKVQEGVYDCRRGTDVIRILVLTRLPLDGQNSPLVLFSGQDERIRFGATNFFPRTDDISTMLMRVFEKYLLEGVDMPQTNAEWRREFLDRLLAETSSDEVLKKFTPQERLKDLSPLDLIQALPPEVRSALPADVLEALRRQPSATTQKPEDRSKKSCCETTHASNFFTTLPSRNSVIGRPVEVIRSWCGSMPNDSNIVADTSSGVTGSVAGAMPLASVVPWA